MHACGPRRRPRQLLPPPRRCLCLRPCCGRARAPLGILLGELAHHLQVLRLRRRLNLCAHEQRPDSTAATAASLSHSALLPAPGRPRHPRSLRGSTGEAPVELHPGMAAAARVSTGLGTPRTRGRARQPAFAEARAAGEGRGGAQARRPASEQSHGGQACGAAWGWFFFTVWRAGWRGSLLLTFWRRRARTSGANRPAACHCARHTTSPARRPGAII